MLILSTEFPPGPGGIGTHAYQLASQLWQRGWAVTVISRQDFVSAQEAERFNDQQPFKVLRIKPIPSAALDGFYRWQLAIRLSTHPRPDIVVATGQRAVWIAALMPWRIPRVAIGHGTEFGVTTPWERVFTRWAFEQADLVICVSQFTANYMRSAGIHPRQIRIIPNGADANRFRVLAASAIPEIRRQHHLEGCSLLLTVGQVNERKGQHVVVRALPDVLKRFPGTHYLLAGLPTDQDALSGLAEELGVRDHVHFLGRVDSVTLVNLVNACDIFLMTSCHTQGGDFEGYGIAVVEAALCGKPAIVSNNSGLAEAVVDGETGVVVPQNDPQRTAEAVIALLADSVRRTQMGEAAWRRASTGQTWTMRAALYHEEFTNLLQQCDC